MPLEQSENPREWLRCETFCTYCGEVMTVPRSVRGGTHWKRERTRDHIIPKSRISPPSHDFHAGTANITYACGDCNTEKASLFLSEWEERQRLELKELSDRYDLVRYRVWRLERMKSHIPPELYGGVSHLDGTVAQQLLNDRRSNTT